MSTLIVARAPKVIDSVISVIRDNGFTAIGVTTDADAISRLESGKVRVLVIGGGVEPDSREALRRKADAYGVKVVEGALGNRDVESYVRQEIVPELRSAGVEHTE